MKAQTFFFIYLWFFFQLFNYHLIDIIIITASNPNMTNNRQRDVMKLRSPSFFKFLGWNFNPVLKVMLKFVLQSSQPALSRSRFLETNQVFKHSSWINLIDPVHMQGEIKFPNLIDCSESRQILQHLSELNEDFREFESPFSRWGKISTISFFPFMLEALAVTCVFFSQSGGASILSLLFSSFLGVVGVLIDSFFLEIEVTR